MTTKRTTKQTRTAATRKSAGRKPAKKAPPAKAAPTRPPRSSARDPRLPAVGSKLTRTFKGKNIVVDVTADGFRYEGKTFTSISAVARHIVGYMISGPVFFRLVELKRPAKKEA